MEQISNSIKFLCFFVTDKLGKTGLTVTIDVYNPAGTKIITDGVVTELGGGLYYYVLASGSVSTVGEYSAVFKTADTTVDQQHIPSLWIVGRAGIECLDQSISSLNPLELSQTLLAASIGNSNNVTIVGEIPDFYENTNVDFSIQINSNGVGVNIAADSVKCMLKEKRTDKDSAAKFNVEAATKTAGGLATFALTNANTKLTPGAYYIEVYWTLDSGEVYVLYSEKINILDKIKDPS